MDDNDIIKEGYISQSPDAVSLSATEKIAEQMKYSVCQILKDMEQDSL